MGYDPKRYDQPHLVFGHTVSGSQSEYQRDRARADFQVRRKLGTAYFYLRPEEKEEYIRSYFRKVK